MNRKEFESKYLKHNFFWIESKEQAKKIQEILIEFGFFCHTGKPEPIIWHKGFSNLVTFQPDRCHKNKYFQKVDIYNPNYSYGKAVVYQNFIEDYNNLCDNKK